MNVFEISFKNHFNHAFGFLIYASIFLLCVIYFEYKFGPESVGFAIKFNVSAFMLFFIPHACIHIKYMSLNYGETLEFNEKENEFIYFSKEEITRFKLSDIISLDNYYSVAYKDGRSQSMPWHSYSYSLIRLQGGRKIIITSLLLPNLNWPCKIPNTKNKYRFYSWPHAN